MGTSAIETCSHSSGLGGFFNINAPNEPQVWVHGSCQLPTIDWWLKFEKFCFECGCSFSSPWSDICKDCATQLDLPFIGWLDRRQAWIAEQTAMTNLWITRHKMLDGADRSMV